MDSDGFLRFNEKAARNLARLVAETKASIVLTTTHRINYTITEWKELFKKRGINPSSISKINDFTTLSDMVGRASEIREWVDKKVEKENFVIIDDDLSINGLPRTIKDRCVLTKPMIGLDEEATQKALNILFKK